MNLTHALCGCAVPAVGAAGSQARVRIESSICDECEELIRSELGNAKFSQCDWNDVHRAVKSLGNRGLKGPFLAAVKFLCKAESGTCGNVVFASAEQWSAAIAGTLKELRERERLRKKT